MARKAKPKAFAEDELRPHKIVGRLIGTRHNEHGEIIAEEVMGEVAIFSAHFDNVRQMVEDGVNEVREEQEMLRERRDEQSGD